MSAEVFDKVQEEMARRGRLVHKEDCTVEPGGSKCNGKYLLGNLPVCGDCGASYRRRTERGKVVWRCATRMEKGTVACSNSPTLGEEWIMGSLGEMVCEHGIYEEAFVRITIEKILVFDEYISICYKDKLCINIKLNDR